MQDAPKASRGLSPLVTILGVASFLPLIVVTVLGAITIADMPANNGVGIFRLLFCAVPSIVIVHFLKTRPWLAAIASLPLAALIHLSVDTGWSAPIAIPFLVGWCGGWYRQERAKDRNPWPILSIAGTILVFSICWTVASLIRSDPFAQDVTQLAKGTLTRVELRTSDGRSGVIADSTKLEEARLALRQTYPYFRNHESWTRQCEVRLFARNEPTPYRVLQAQVGNAANPRSFWITVPEGEFQNLALYELMQRHGFFETKALERGPAATQQ